MTPDTPRAGDEVVRHIHYGDVAAALNRLVRTNFADRNNPGWVPEVTIVPRDEAEVEAALDQVEEVVWPLGVQTIMAELESPPENTDEP